MPILAIPTAQETVDVTEPVGVLNYALTLEHLENAFYRDGLDQFDEDAYADDAAFLETAAALENVGVSAYNGAGQFLTDPGLLTTAGSIVSVEARHAAYLNLVNDEDPFPSAFDEAATPAETLEAAGPFLAS